MVAPALSAENGVTPRIWGGFLVLPENRSAVRAARRVVRSMARRKPGKNDFTGPLFFHGPPGTGKSALVVALIHRVIESDAGRTARCIPASELPRRGAEGEDGPDDFAEMLLCDLLAIEDLQHLPEKHVNALCRVLDYRASRRRPTILTSSLGPARLSELPRRLTSRLAAGLVVRLDLPAVSSRKLLAEQFAKDRGINLDEAAANWLAEHSPGGARAILGAIEQLRGLPKTGGIPLEANAVMARLKEAAAPTPDESPMERIVNRVGHAFGVRPRDMLGSGRQRQVMVPRHVAMYLSRLVAKVPLTRIGAHFGGRDHTTVMHALKKMEESIQDDAKLAITVRELQAELE